jgi:hypothetical protein
MCVGTTLSLGSFDRTLELVEELEEADLVEFDVDSVYGTRAVVAAYRGQADEAARLRVAEEASFADVSRSEFLAGRHIEKAHILSLAGDLAGAFDEGMTGAGLAPYSQAPVVAMRSALWLGDPERARRAHELLVAAIDRGRAIGAVHRSLGAGLAALEGRPGEAAAGYRAAASTLRALDATLDLAYCQLDHTILIGPDDPGGRAAAVEAREILTRLGATALVERLDAALERWTSGWPARRGSVPSGAASATATAPTAGGSVDRAEA